MSNRIQIFGSVILSVIAFDASALMITENFNSATINSSLEQTGSATWTSGVAGSGGLSGELVARLSGSNRGYLRTVDSNYNTIDFTMDITFTTGGAPGGSLVMIGYGEGTPGGSYSEPTNSIFLRAHAQPDNSANGLGISNGSNVTYQSGFADLTNGTHKLELQKIGNILTFSVDKDFNGSFDSSMSLDLNTYSYLNSTNSHLFFGTGSPENQFDNLQITVNSASVPTPETFWLVSTGLMGIGFFSRKRPMR